MNRASSVSNVLALLTPVPFPEIDARRLPCTRAPELWHSTRYEDKERARELCGHCPALVQCRQAGRQGREFGMWGGEDERDRNRLGRAPLGWRPGKYDYVGGDRT